MPARGSRNVREQKGGQRPPLLLHKQILSTANPYHPANTANCIASPEVL